MSKAEDRAIEKYPVEMHEVVGWRCVDKNAYKRQYFVEGYHQAEKDLELTPKDISTIYSLVINAVFELRSENPSFKGEDIYQEVLKRFQQEKNHDTRRKS